MTKSVDTNGQELWQGFIESIRSNLSSHVVQTWFEPALCVGADNATIQLALRDSFARDWLSNHYLTFIHDGLTRFTGREMVVELQVVPELFMNTEPDDESLDDLEEDLQAPEQDRLELVAPLNDTDDSPIRIVRESLDPERRSVRQLNRRYTFNEFVCGPSNQFAYAATKAVAGKPGQSYNPLFIFGGVGLGKTHLLTAIGHQVLQERPGARVVYTTAEQFSNEVVNAVMGGKLEEFRSKYRKNADLLLIDDIQLLAGKKRTQHELFHLFNTLYDSQRQIVFTSDKLPHELPEMEERLINRFQWGLIADIQPPEVETRVAILRQKAEKDGYYIPDDVAFFLAKNCSQNVRELEGALVRVTAHASLSNTPLTAEHAQRVLADILPGNTKKITVSSIQKLVANYFQLKVSDLKSKERRKVIVRPRQIAMYLCRKHTEHSFPELSSEFGKKDHTTVLSACKKIDSMLQQDPSLRSQVVDLERQMDVLVS
ncbi:MAG: chromosomal replication initiator protein DnaA [Deltaproteobacteria bacterium]|nr:chromosomal replication initiator protein DnaA [Deltaproteobacteria bacterium]MBT6435389.1 chromosomal replication initiator protein DnaA [Deltaproteobacteria bacterium]MBT6491417.1 chromosomal replication initiator protein DnaA [Deltaproteobacteria bacterium]